MSYTDGRVLVQGPFRVRFDDPFLFGAIEVGDPWGLELFQFAEGDVLLKIIVVVVEPWETSDFAIFVGQNFDGGVQELVAGYDDMTDDSPAVESVPLANTVRAAIVTSETPLLIAQAIQNDPVTTGVADVYAVIASTE